MFIEATVHGHKLDGGLVFWTSKISAWHCREHHESWRPRACKVLP